MSCQGHLFKEREREREREEEEEEEEEDVSPFMCKKILKTNCTKYRTFN